MTLEGEYYILQGKLRQISCCVAILMTLEGEYYLAMAYHETAQGKSRNPHDIGRRILLQIIQNLDNLLGVAILMTLEGEYYWIFSSSRGLKKIVAILMTLEGEYYKTPNKLRGLVCGQSQSS